MAVSPPRPKGPALNALRAFETAARRGSFSAAADELCVTPGAVAQQVKALEAWSGMRLFTRRAQGVELTALGASVLPALSNGFDQLGEAVQALRSQAMPDRVRIAALPSIAQLWLSPRLPAIRAAAPGLTISISAVESPPNLKREPFDLSIFFLDLPSAAGATELARDVIFPVCSPAVAARLTHPADLVHVTCLHDANWTEDWPRWIASLDPVVPLDIGGPVFSLYNLAVEEAKNGAGVLIGHEPLVRADLDSGALVAPFESRVSLGRSLSMTLADGAVANPALERLVRALTAPG